MTPTTSSPPHKRQRRPADSLTPPQVARRYGIKEDKVLSWIRSGELVAVNIASKIGGRPRWIITLAALAAFEARRSSAATVAQPKQARRRQATGYTEYI